MKYKEMIIALKPLGFEHQNNGVFYHKLTARSFDFSAMSLESVICKVFMDGMLIREREIKSRIREIIG